MNTTFVSKLGKTNAGERTRIWLEGQRLTDAGFKVGSKFVKRWTKTALIISRTDEAMWNETEYANRGRVSGKGEKPVIDITGKIVNTTFGAATHVKVVFSDGFIEIRKMQA